MLAVIVGPSKIYKNIQIKYIYESVLKLINITEFIKYKGGGMEPHCEIPTFTMQITDLKENRTCVYMNIIPDIHMCECKYTLTYTIYTRTYTNMDAVIALWTWGYHNRVP